MNKDALTPTDQADDAPAAASKVKTAQPFSDDIGDDRYNQMGGAPKPRPDQVDDPAMMEESDKTTQRQE